MGANSSVQKQTSISSIINNQLNKTVSDLKVTYESDRIINQVMKVYFENMKVDGNITLSQDSKIDVKMLTKIDTQQATKMANAVQNQIFNKLKQNLKQENKGFNFPFQVNSNVQETHIESYLENNLTNIIETTIENKISYTENAKQELEVTMKNIEVGGNISINQTLIFKSISDSIASTIVDNTLTNKSDNEAIAEILNSAAQKNTGLTLAIGLAILLLVGALLAFGIFGKRILSYIIPIFILIFIAGAIYFSTINAIPRMIICIVFAVILTGIQIYVMATDKTKNIGKMAEEFAGQGGNDMAQRVRDFGQRNSNMFVKGRNPIKGASNMMGRMGGGMRLK